MLARTVSANFILHFATMAVEARFQISDVELWHTCRRQSEIYRGFLLQPTGAYLFATLQVKNHEYVKLANCIVDALPQERVPRVRKDSTALLVFPILSQTPAMLPGPMRGVELSIS